MFPYIVRSTALLERLGDMMRAVFCFDSGGLHARLLRLLRLRRWMGGRGGLACTWVDH